MSKGSKRRPEDTAKFNENYNKIFGKKKKASKLRNLVARFNKLRGGFHTPKKFSRKTKHKKDLN